MGVGETGQIIGETGVGETGVGEMGVGETGQIIGETGVGETGVGEMGVTLLSEGDFVLHSPEFECQKRISNVKMRYAARIRMSK